MAASWIKTIRQSAALIGLGWALIPSSGGNVRFAYDKNLKAQDSVYAVRLAEALYSYEVYADKGDPLFKSVPKDSLESWSQQSAVFDYCQGDHFFTRSLPKNMEEMMMAAREEKKGFVMLYDEADNKNFIADTSDIHTLIDYKNEDMQANNCMPVPLYIEFSLERNAEAISAGHLSRSGIFLNIGLLTEYERLALNTIVDHEVGHFRLFEHENNLRPVDLKGHEKNLSNCTRISMSIEGECDDHAASKKEFTRQSLVGMCSFFTDHYVSPAQWKKFKTMQKDEAISSLANVIFLESRDQICYASTHPPDLYRFLNMAKTAKIDITTLSREFEKKHIISVQYADDYKLGK